MKAIPILAIAAAVFYACAPVDQTTFSGDLQVGVRVEGTLEAEAPDTFNLVLGPDMYLYGVAEQLTVDVQVRLYDSVWNQLGLFDGPGRGPEEFWFETKDSGKHYLVVAPFEQQSGDYILELKKAEPLATDPRQRVDQLFTPYRGDVPGGVIGIIRDGELIFSKAYGVASLTYDIPFRVNTPSNIGSVSKQFTAMAILLLEQQGKLSLEDNVRKYYPELPEFDEKITLKNLLNHTNGLREVYNLMPLTGWKGEDQLRRENVVEILARQEELQAEPGEEFNYNNSAFILLAGIVEKVSGQKFPEWMKENIFDPLGMESTMVRRDPATIVPEAAQGYTMDSTGYKVSGDLYASYGAGGIYTTVEDFGKWLGNFGDPVLGDSLLIRKLTTPDTLNNGDTMTYALGIGVGEFRGRKQFSHGGADLAHRAMLVYFPEFDGGVAVLSNNYSFPVDRVAFSAAEVFFRDELGPDEDEKEKADSAGVEVPERLLKAYAGKYRMPAVGFELEFKLEEGVLIFSAEGQPDLKMIPRTDSVFAYTGVDATVKFRVDAKGKVTGGVHYQGGMELEIVPFEPYRPGPDELSAYEGDYFSDELQTFYEIELKDTLLVLHIPNSEEIKLSPVEKDEFKGNVFFIGQMEFHRDDRGWVKGFEVSNGRTRNIRFEKLPGSG